MEWGKPENIIWLGLVLVFILLAVRTHLWRIRTRKKFADEEIIPRLFINFSPRRQLWNVILVSLGLVFITISLMDPLFGEEEVKIKREGIDVIYALDLSNSMDVQDIAPNRLDKAKKIISESLNQLGGDRVALIVFAANAYVISPFTNDYNAVLSYVNSAETNLLSEQGTNFSDVLFKASELFQRTPNTEKLLVILSDGEDNEASISKSIKIAKENKIHIVTMGFGTANGGPIPIQVGGFEEYKLNRNGEIVISKLNESSLKSLAQNSGKYIHVNHTNEALNQLHEYLNKLEKNIQETAFTKDKKHVFQWFLIFGIILIFIDTLTTEHKLFKNKKS